MIYRFNILSSTNDYTKKHIDELKDWDIVVANAQVKGRGRYQRQWYSPKGGLWFSTIVSPDFMTEDYGLVPIITGISVIKALIKFGVNAGLKWPNDIILKNKKIGGILSELVKNRIIIGIGINLNFKNELFNQELKKIATTIFSELDKRIPQEKLLKNIISEIQKNILLIKKERDKIKELWKKFDIFKGKEIEIISGNKAYKGKEYGIDEDGKLILNIDGNDQKFISGEIVSSKKQ